MRQDFTYGVDLGWVSQLEKQGITWTDKSGKNVDPLQALKSMGATAVRLRVFVNPPENAMWRKPKKQAYGREFGERNVCWDCVMARMSLKWQKESRSWIWI